MEQRLQTKVHLYMLQSCVSPHSPPSASGELPAVSPQSYMGMVEKAAAQMEKTLSNELKIFIHVVRLSAGGPASRPPGAAQNPMRDEFIKEMWNLPLDQPMMIQQCDTVDVTLTPIWPIPALWCLQTGSN